MDQQKVADLINGRSGQQSAPIQALPIAGRAFMVHAEIEKANGTAIYDAAIRMTDDPRQPYWVLSWTSR
jgi:general secretion pathway protein K